MGGDSVEQDELMIGCRISSSHSPVFSPRLWFDVATASNLSDHEIVLDVKRAHVHDMKSMSSRKTISPKTVLQQWKDPVGRFFDFLSSMTSGPSLETEA
jgi:hypothetical protein